MLSQILMINSLLKSFFQTKKILPTWELQLLKSENLWSFCFANLTICLRGASESHSSASNVTQLHCTHPLSWRVSENKKLPVESDHFHILTWWIKGLFRPNQSWRLLEQQKDKPRQFWWVLMLLMLFCFFWVWNVFYDELARQLSWN